LTGSTDHSVGLFYLFQDIVKKLIILLHLIKPVIIFPFYNKRNGASLERGAQLGKSQNLDYQAR
jgi:hypothetical protein